jgi:hypothetical protein
VSSLAIIFVRHKHKKSFGIAPVNIMKLMILKKIRVICIVCSSSRYAASVHAKFPHIMGSSFISIGSGWLSESGRKQKILVRRLCTNKSWVGENIVLLIAWGLLTELSKRICSESCFFLIISPIVLMVHLCMVPRGVAISLIGRTVFGFLLVFEWADT